MGLRRRSRSRNGPACRRATHFYTMGSEVRQAWHLAHPRGCPSRESGRQGAPRPRHPPPVRQGCGAPARPPVRAPGARDGPGRPEPLPPGLSGPPGVRALPQAPPRGDGRGAGDRLRRGAAPPRLPGAGPGDLPRPDGLLHRALVRAALPRAALQAGPAGRPLRQEGPRPRTAASSWRAPSSRSWKRTTWRRSTWAGSCPCIRSRRACSSARCGRFSTGSSRPTPGRPPTSCRTSSAAGGISCRRPRRTGRVHFPEQLDDVEAARRRFAFEDFFVLQVGLDPQAPAAGPRARARRSRPRARWWRGCFASCRSR